MSSLPDARAYTKIIVLLYYMYIACSSNDPDIVFSSPDVKAAYTKVKNAPLRSRMLHQGQGSSKVEDASNHFQDFHRIFEMKCHSIFHLFPLFLLSRRDSNITLFKVPTSVFPHHHSNITLRDVTPFKNVKPVTKVSCHSAIMRLQPSAYYQLEVSRKICILEHV